jgi:hypothetical protein
MFFLNSNKIINLIVLLLIIILIEGLLCRPILGLYLYEPYKFCSNYFFLHFWEENGFVETLQSLFLFFAIIYLIKARTHFKDIKLINFFLITKIIVLTYYLGEEISWGQHFFNWTSPDWFLINNNQNETNIHNISNIFDQLPRTLVLIWCSLSVPLILCINNISQINKSIFKIFCPDKKLLLISILLLLLVLPDLIIDKFNLHPGFVDEIGKPIESAYFYTMISLNFLRLSELHEFIFASYFLFYSWSFKNSAN